MASNKNESAILVMTDIHYGKKTSSFNRDVCRKRINRIADKVTSINSLLTGQYKFDELVIFLLGDVNDGNDIYPGQANHQECSNVEEQAWEFAEFYARFVRRLLPLYPKVRIETVPGNHGRSGRGVHEGANWDIVAYRYLGHHLRNDNVPVIVGTGDSLFVRKVKVRKHNYLLFHGHQVKGSFAGIPSYGLSTRVLRWATTKYSPFNMALCGHFHSYFNWDVNDVDMLMSGTCVTDDLYSLDQLGWASSCKWPFFGVNDKRSVTWSYKLEADDDGKEKC